MDEAAKKTTLRMIPYALYLVGCRAREVKDPQQDLNAFLGSWVTQVSFRPPLVVLGLKRGTRSHAMVAESGVLVLNVLAADQKDLAQRFFKDVEVTATAMAGTPYRLGETGAPVLTDLAAHVECRVLAMHDHGGDHDVVVAEVVAASVNRPGVGPLTHAQTGWHYGG